MMQSGSMLDKECLRIFEEKGGQIADEARTILLEEKSLSDLRGPLRHVSHNWRDPATPSMIILSYEAVGGESDRVTNKVALAMTLLNLSMSLWDDIIDTALHKGFIPTLRGKFGEGVSLMVGGLASAKAFSILGAMRADQTKRQAIVELVWNYCKEIARAETANLKLRSRKCVRPEDKMKTMEMQAASLEALPKIGALLGNGSKDEARHLGNYGRYLGMILELQKDFKVSVNLTLELAERIRNSALPYTLLWARDHSEMVMECLPLLEDAIEPVNIRRLVEEILKTKALENITGLLTTLRQKAEKELAGLESNSATERLRFLVESQPRIFLESLATSKLE